MFNLIAPGLDIDKMARSVAAGEISGKMIFSMIAGSIFRLILILLVIEIVIETMYKNRVKNYKGEVEGEIVEVLNSDKGAMAGTFPIYQYEVNNHKYIVKPLFLIFGSKLNQKYHDSEDITCITYRRKHGGTSRTKYHEGESIIVKYNIDDPKKHEILNDKDKLFAFKVAKIGIILSMIFPIAVYIMTIFIKD